MSKFIDRNLLERVATRNGFDPESLLQVIQRFESMRPTLRKQAIIRAIQTENWRQLEAFICLGSWVSLRAIQTLPPALAAIPEVAEIWKNESLAWLLAGVRVGSDRSKKIPLEWQSSEAKQQWLSAWKNAWRKWVEYEIGQGRDTLRRIPESLGEDLEFQSQRISLWCHRCIGRSHSELQSMPKDVRQTPHGYAALRTGVVRLFKSGDQTNFLCLRDLANLEPRLQSDLFVLESRKSEWLKYLIARHMDRPANPEADLLQDSEVHTAWLRAWIKHLESGISHYHFSYIPTELANEGRILAARRTGALKWLRTNPSRAGTPEKDLLQDSEVYAVWVRAWIKNLKTNFSVNIPTELANESRILEARRAGVLKWIRTNCPNIAEVGRLKLDFLRTDDLVRQAWEEGFITRHRGKPVADCEELLKEWLLGQMFFGRSAVPVTRLWSALAERVALDLNVAPVECREDSECLRSWLMGWIGYIASADMDSIRTLSCIPRVLREHEPVKAAIRHRWLHYVNRSNTKALDRLAEIPRELADHPSFADLKNSLWNNAVLSGERTLSALPENVTPSPELKQQFQEWSQIPIERRSCPDFRTAWKRLFALSKHYCAALDHLALFPAADRKLVSFWRNATDPRKRDIHDALRTLRRFPWAIDDLHKDYLNHPLIRECAEEGMLELIQKYLSYEEVLPEPLAQTNRIRSFLEMRNEEAVTKQMAEERGQASAEGTEAKTSGKSELSRWEREIRKDGVKYTVMPIRLRGEPCLLAALRESVGPLVRKNPGIWMQLPAIIREDECLQRVFRIATRGPLAGLEVKNAA
jgi:hypothetical protein